MNALSARRRFQSAINNLEINFYYVSGRAIDPNTFKLPKPENAGPIRSNITELVNHATNYLHSNIIESAIDKALTGDHAPKPSGTDILKAVAPTFTRYAAQILKTPLGMTGAVALCGAAIMMNPQVRGDVTKMLDNTATITAQATDMIGKKIIDNISPTLPINLAIIPTFEFLKS